MTSQRNGWIDLLRALSATAVVLFHFNVLVPDQPAGSLAGAWHRFWLHGHLGVPVFFALSGYCIMPGWLRADRPAGFLSRRLRRFLPPYWCSLLLVVALALVFKLARGINDVAVLPRDPGSILATLFILTDPLTSVPRLNWVYWTLTPLLGYSVLTGLLLFVPVRARIPLLVGLHAALCAADLWLQPPGAGFVLFIKYWPMFGIGAALALRTQHRTAGSLMLAVSAGHALASLLIGHDDLYYALASVLTVIALAGLIHRILPGWTNPGVKLGRISYSLFLVHVPVGIYLLHRLLPAEPASAASLIGGQLALLAACIAAAALFYLGCEKPFAPANASAA